MRIKGDSLRLRGSRSEVARHLARDCLEDTIHFTARVGLTGRDSDIPEGSLF